MECLPKFAEAKDRCCSQDPFHALSIQETPQQTQYLVKRRILIWWREPNLFNSWHSLWYDINKMRKLWRWKKQEAPRHCWNTIFWIHCWYWQENINMIMCPVKCLSVADMSSCPLSTLLMCLHPPDTTVHFHTSNNKDQSIGEISTTLIIHPKIV